jgi:hypothetical protein
MRRVLRAVLPGGGILLLAAVLFMRGGDGLAEAVAGQYAVALYGVGLALAAYFHRSRVLITLLGLGLVHLWAGRTGGEPELLVALGCVLVVLMALLTLPDDRGILSPGGLSQLGASVLLAGAPALLFRDPERVGAFVHRAPLGDLLPGWPTLPGGMLLAAVPAVLVAGFALYRRNGPVEWGLTWGLVTVLIAIHPWMSGPGTELFLMAAGLTLTVSVLETSYAMAYRDELTGLPARRALLRDLDGLRGRFTLAMVDVDHFKRINDRHGHEVGDQVLRLVATRLAAAPGPGKAYRYGGEEFTLLYPGRVADEVLPTSRRRAPPSRRPSSRSGPGTGPGESPRRGRGRGGGGRPGSSPSR